MEVRQQDGASVRVVAKDTKRRGDVKVVGVLRLRDCKERNRYAQDDRVEGLRVMR